MNTNTYNGWTNYATWRIALEWFDSSNHDESETDPYQLSKYLQEYVEEALSIDCNNSMALDYAFSFLSDVNWYEIAEHLIQEVTNEN